MHFIQETFKSAMSGQQQAIGHGHLLTNLLRKLFKSSFVRYFFHVDTNMVFDELTHIFFFFYIEEGNGLVLQKQNHFKVKILALVAEAQGFD